MADEGGQARQAPRSRNTLRLTFRFDGTDVQLVSREALEMICPPSVGEQPEAGKHGGFWVELQDAERSTTFFRVLHDPLRSSVEIHSPDGDIHHEFGRAQPTMFEVLVPDDPAATDVVLMGDYAPPPTGRPEERSAGAREMARFDVSDGRAGPTGSGS